MESQGHGTLHLHLLIWLDNTPSPDEIKVLLKSESFRAKLVSYIHANLRAYLPGLESAESIKQIPRESDIGYNRPPNPRTATYQDDLKSFELRLARAEQIHTCKPHQCLRWTKKGTYKCKRNAPFECSPADVVDESGRWNQKRLYGYVNGWVPSILVNGRCNNDGKFLTNGNDTKNITFYVTTYAAKKQSQTHNLSAIMTKAYAYHLNHPNAEYLGDIQKNNELLLYRVASAMIYEQEIAAPMVMSYLMDWNDTFCSHHYTPVYWSSFMASLYRTHPDLSLSAKHW